MANEPIKILIIEDDTFLSSMYATKFEIEGFRVITALDGESGIRSAKDELPDIILLDIMLPQMNGFDVLRTLKKDDALKKIPIVLLTNMGQKDDIEQGLNLGADDYMIKAHFMPSEVVGKIRKILGIKTNN